MKILKSVLFISLVVTQSLNVFAAGPGDLEESASIDREQQQLEWCFIYSNMLGYNISYITNPRLYLEVSNWLGTPYEYSGNTRKGVDCSGFVCGIFHDCYDKVLAGSARDIYAHVEAVKKADLREGDLVFFNIRKKRVSHVGIYLGENKFAHASVQRGVIISDLGDPYYLKYFYKAGRIIL